MKNKKICLHVALRSKHISLFSLNWREEIHQCLIFLWWWVRRRAWLGVWRFGRSWASYLQGQLHVFYVLILASLPLLLRFARLLPSFAFLSASSFVVLYSILFCSKFGSLRYSSSAVTRETGALIRISQKSFRQYEWMVFSHAWGSGWERLAGFGAFLL